MAYWWICSAVQLATGFILYGVVGEVFLDDLDFAALHALVAA